VTKTAELAGYVKEKAHTLKCIYVPNQV